MKLHFFILLVLLYFLTACNSDHPSDPKVESIKDTKITVQKTVSNNDLCLLEEFNIYGENFYKNKDSLHLIYNSIPINIIDISDKEIIASIPYCFEDSGIITLINGTDSIQIEETILNSRQFCFEIDSPKEGPYIPGQEIIITGNGFEKYANSLEFIIGARILPYQIISDTECKIQIPTMSYGRKVVQVYVLSRSAEGFQIVVGDSDPDEVFEVTKVSPINVFRGDIFTIYGSGFGNDLSNCKVVIESYLPNSFSEAEIVSLQDSKIEVKVPEAAIDKSVRVKVVIGHTEKLLSQTLNVIRSNFNYNNLSLIMSGLRAETHFVGTNLYYDLEDENFYRWEEMQYTQFFLTMQNIWIGDSISWSDSEEYKNKSVRISLDSNTSTMKYFRYEYFEKYNYTGHSKNGNSIIQYSMDLKDIPYTNHGDYIEINLNKTTIANSGFHHYTNLKEKITDYGTLVIDYTKETTGKFQFPDNFYLTIILSK